MATAEWVQQALAAGKSYQELPERLRTLLPQSEWKNRVKEHCIQRGCAWADCSARTCCAEAEYYEDLLRQYRQGSRLFPYHLADYVCRVMRVTPHRYYCDVLVAWLKDERQYDQLPNFTAADIVRQVGIGRNEYIAVLNACKGKRLLWRVNRGLARELLPQEPANPRPEPWWEVVAVNLGEAEYRALLPVDKAALQAAAAPGGVPASSLDPELLLRLYRAGTVYLDVPVAPGDHISIPPLEGFVSNVTSEAGENGRGDPLEKLLYAAFVAASGRASVAQLASILSVDLARLQQALGVACRLGFASKVEEGEGGDGRRPSASMDGGFGLELADDEVDGSAREAAAAAAAAGTGAQAAGGAPATGGGGSGIALVVDSDITGYLMMGALSPGLKRHSVTLFEGGRITGAASIAELMSELRASVGASAAFEGEMAHLAAYARGLSAALEAVHAASGGGGGARTGGAPLEVLRKENLSGLAPAAALRVLSHSYAAVVPVTPLAPPPLPLPLPLLADGSPTEGGDTEAEEAAVPTNFGPTAQAATPWLQLALWAAAGEGPPALVLAAGQRLVRLPPELAGASHALLWPWSSAAVRAHEVPAAVPAACLLLTLNEWLARTAVAVAPLVLRGESDTSGSSSGSNAWLATVDVPLPLLLKDDDANESSNAGSVGGGDEGNSGGGNSGGGDAVTTVRGVVHGSGEVVDVPLPPGVRRAAYRLGLLHAIGCLRLLQVTPGSTPAAVLPLRDGEGDGKAGSAHGRRQQRCASGEAANGDGRESGDGGGADSRSGAGNAPRGLLSISGDPAAWLPLELRLGLPLVPPELCELVCAAASGRRFLEPGPRAAHTDGQRRLQAEMQSLIQRHGACGDDSGEADDAGAFLRVGPPLANLRFDGRRLAPAADLGPCVQGGGLPW